MVFYLIGATLTFGILLHAFWKDKTASKADITSWAVLVVATLIWFLVLPRILQKKFQSAKPASAKNWVSEVG